MTVYQQISHNKWKTTFLITVFIALILALGYFGGLFIGGDIEYAYSYLFFASIISIVMTIISYFAGDSLSLAASGAQKIEKEDSPYVWNMVENLSITTGIPMPRIFIIDDPVMNAFATGRDPKHASIALTTGIINGLENEELEAVIGHELSHIKNYDIRVMTIVVVLVGVITLLSDWMLRMTIFGRGGGDNDNKDARLQLVFMIVGIVLIILSPIAAQLIQLAVSRKREYLADASSVLMTRYADGLIGALKKISQQEQAGMQMKKANHATAHLFFANPFKKTKLVSRLFSTHPPIEDRIAALQKMGGGQ
jgi:heat shock protein HtpX